MTKIIFLNGPPGCGKDTLVSELIPHIHLRHIKMSAPYKRMVAGLFDIDMNTLEARKDEQFELLRRGVHTKDTLRELLIHLSEDVFKPRYGEDFLAKIFCAQVKHTAAPFVVCSDAGFNIEVLRVIHQFGAANCILLRIHREGRDFSSDSRSYVRDGLCSTYDINNNSTKHMLAMLACRAIQRHFKVTFLKEPDWGKDLGK
jgi:hypothetical protein